MAGAVRRALDEQQFDTLAAVVVLDEGGRVCGVVRVTDLFAVEPSMRLDALMDADPPLVLPGDDAAVIAAKAVRHNESLLVAVDADRRLVGIVPPERLMTTLLARHEQDLSRLGGVLHDTEAARAASYESVMRRFVHRMPWLLFGLAGAMLSAILVGRFEERLSANVAIAFFIPAIVYMADAVGTQTEALIVRGLAVGVPVRPLVRLEVLTGVFVGAAIAAIAYPVTLWWWGDPKLALALALALLSACGTATVVALALPALMRRINVDPAFGAGPLATVVQDLCSIAIYLAVVIAVAA